MTNKGVQFHEAAVEEYQAAFEWYFERSELASSRFAGELNQAITLVSEAPQRWPASIHGTRKFLLRRFPFAVFYRELPTVIQVLAVAHTHRRPGYWKKRI